MDLNDIRLVESSGKVGTYFCLSHAWGTHQTLRTTTANYQSHKLKIPWTPIPRTFQDVIRLTRSLGVQYFWIDSLCIIQDNPVDWAMESGSMVHISKLISQYCRNICKGFQLWYIFR